ncbi:MAG: L-threonylcarbamoyladenylate synthase [Myxococcota bacterium]
MDLEAVEAAAAELRAGRLVAFPTETVYGLGGDALNPESVAKIFSAKGRPTFDPLICHIARADELPKLAREVTEAAGRLASRFWPGPLTLILPKQPAVPDLVTAGEPTVGVRIPHHPIAGALLEAFGGPIAAPSANLFGAVSPTQADHIDARLGAYVLDGGPCRVGVESTIVACLPGKPITLLRPGGLAREALEAEVGAIEVPPPRAFPSASPGRLERHYAPATPLRLLDAPGVLEPRADVGYLAFSTPPPPGYGAVEVLSPTGRLPEAAQRLFAALRRLDRAGLTRLVAEPVPEEGLGVAIMDRLRRAATLPNPRVS